MITIFMRDGCAFCTQTKNEITKGGATYKEVNMTDDQELGHRVATAAHSFNVPVVTTAESIEDFNHENMYVGWNIRKLRAFIKQELGE